MQKTRNNCFGSKKRNSTLSQAKTNKHECRNITSTALILTCFRLSKGYVCFLDQKQLFRVSCFWLYCFTSSIILQNTSLWCFSVVLCYFHCKLRMMMKYTIVLLIINTSYHKKQKIYKAWNHVLKTHQKAKSQA